MLDAIWTLAMTVPTKKNKEINSKFKRLRKEQWYKHKYDVLGHFNPTIRKFIYTYDIEDMLKDEKKINKFKEELDVLLRKERI